MIRIALKKKPAKPHKDYPLYRHKTGQFAKKIRGKTHYFGTDPDQALAKYLKEKDDLLAGREPINEGMTVKELCNQFIDSKKKRVKSGELTPRSLHDYQQTCEKIIKTLGAGRRVIGLRPLDFENLRASYSCGMVSLGNEIGRIKVIFNFAYNWTFAKLILHGKIYPQTTFRRPF